MKDGESVRFMPIVIIVATSVDEFLVVVRQQRFGARKPIYTSKVPKLKPAKRFLLCVCGGLWNE
jgi:hypothetical protein